MEIERQSTTDNCLKTSTRQFNLLPVGHPTTSPSSESFKTSWKKEMGIQDYQITYGKKVSNTKSQTKTDTVFIQFKMLHRLHYSGVKNTKHTSKHINHV